MSLHSEMPIELRFRLRLSAQIKQIHSAVFHSWELLPVNNLYFYNFWIWHLDIFTSKKLTFLIYSWRILTTFWFTQKNSYRINDNFEIFCFSTKSQTRCYNIFIRKIDILKLDRLDGWVSADHKFTSQTTITHWEVKLFTFIDDFGDFLIWAWQMLLEIIH